MRKQSSLVIGLLVSFYLTACSSFEQHTYDAPLIYRCESGERFSVGYAPDGHIAELGLSEKVYPLKRIRSGSGARYILANDTPDTYHPIMLFTKGNEARLEFKGTIFKNCAVDN
ncbi:MliC family protein [Vibrio olivae]|uniref:MliC family protein n=1 Tax=Vibrio olivae TaxID=1243002 RepID=A0ABV5HGX5_9VIBR